MSRIESTLTNAVCATTIGFVATKNGMWIADALENAGSAIAETVHTISEITVIATGAIIGGVTFLGKLGGFVSAESPRAAIQLVVNTVREETHFGLHALMGAGLGSGLAWQVGEQIRAFATAKEEILFKVASTLTIVGLMVVSTEVNRAAVQNIALGAVAAEMTGILLSSAFPSFPAKASLSAVIGGATAGMFTLVRG